MLSKSRAHQYFYIIETIVILYAYMHDIRGSVQIKTPLFLYVKHQISSIQILHHKE